MSDPAGPEADGGHASDAVPAPVPGPALEPPPEHEWLETFGADTTYDGFREPPGMGRSSG